MKSTNRHYYLHGIRVLLFGVLLSALLIVKLNAVSFTAAIPQKGNVLAYATSMSRGELLNATNSYRAQNGLGALSSNGLLDSAAQAKAQHMIDNNYWSHVAPDGTQPWFFFDQAGYAYQAAGENLAYGFMTSSAVVDAWMNSASHRANILGDYVDVGFGFVNGANYQNGQYTVVVAHYGKPQQVASPTPAPAPTAAPTAPSPTSTPTTPAQTPSNTPTTPVESPVADTTGQDAGADEDSTPSTPVSTDSDTVVSDQAAVPITTGNAKSVNVLERLQLSSPPAAAIVSIVLTVVAAAGFALTHRSLVRHAVASGEKFVMTHPLFDTLAVSAICVLILTTTVGYIN